MDPMGTHGPPGGTNGAPAPRAHPFNGETLPESLIWCFKKCGEKVEIEGVGAPGWIRSEMLRKIPALVELCSLSSRYLAVELALDVLGGSGAVVEL